MKQKLKRIEKVKRTDVCNCISPLCSWPSYITDKNIKKVYYFCSNASLYLLSAISVTEI